MSEALKQAKAAQEQDEVPVGAIIAHEGKIIARAHNQVETLKDPTAHAEMIAITQAASYLGNKWLHGCEIFVTIEPCSMCVGALVLARIKRICFGACDEKTGACGSVFNIAQSDELNHKIDITPGVLSKECAEIISKFFKAKR
ncbi:MAG: tRNA adenosine(34) deaminase TadA [Candidatus Omnitrophica bacterium]|nr:tRNA adenosine(34) deaminase TadA [Candidatus Omnitrophota bacterium]MBU1997279.1 tRNA adenosine(34) deaminase TadA [Candidatus Omnitrophota bacterium]